MRYKKFQPHKKLYDFVECYFVWEGNTEKSLEIESPPSALCSLVINSGDEYFISNKKYDKKIAPKIFICGQALGNYTLHLNGKVDMVGIAFKPSAIFHFYGVPMYGLTDERICISEFSKPSYQELHEIIQDQLSTQKKIQLLEEFVLVLLDRNKFGDMTIIHASNKIFDEKGRTNIAELIESAPMSRRNFERKFLEEVGLSPKTYAKIRRFGYTCSLMAGKRDINLMDVLYEGGYYDQSHFIKDFKYFSGRTPRRYAKTNLELANYVDGITLVEKRLQEEGQ